MLRAMLRDLRAHPGRVAMTLVAIVLGVAFVVATWVVSDSAAATVARRRPATDLAVRVSAARNAAGALLAADVATGSRALPGVDRATGVVVGHAGAGPARRQARRHVLPGRGRHQLGRLAAVHPGRRPRARSAPARWRWRRRRPRRPGWRRRHRPGAARRRQLRDRDRGRHLHLPHGRLRRAVARPSRTTRRPRCDALGRRLRPGRAVRRRRDPVAAAAARPRSGTGFDVRTGAELAADRPAGGRRARRSVVRNFLLAFAGVALMAGMFVIANTFTMLVAQRTRQFALLRAVGARRRQVRRAVLAEAVVLGLVGATVGVGVGVGLGWLAMRLLRTTGETVVFTVSPVGDRLGYLVGVVVTVVAAYGSARRAPRWRRWPRSAPTPRCPAARWWCGPWPARCCRGRRGGGGRGDLRARADRPEADRRAWPARCSAGSACCCSRRCWPRRCSVPLSRLVCRRGSAVDPPRGAQRHPRPAPHRGHRVRADDRAGAGDRVRDRRLVAHHLHHRGDPRRGAGEHPDRAVRPAGSPACRPAVVEQVAQGVRRGQPRRAGPGYGEVTAGGRRSAEPGSPRWSAARWAGR